MTKVYKPIFSLTKKIATYIKEINLLNQSNPSNPTPYKVIIDLYKKRLKENLAYQEARQRIEKEKSSLITKQLIQDLNGLVMSGDSKIINDSQHVPIEWEGKEIYTSSSSSPDDLDNLLAWISVTNIYPVEIKAAIAHCEFVKIHPFHNGNGRTARLLSTLILYQSGYSLNICYALEASFETNKESYYKALDFRNESQRSEGYIEKYQDDRDITPWIEYFCCSLLHTMTQEKIQLPRLTESYNVGVSTHCLKDTFRHHN